MKIYFAASIRGGRDDWASYLQIVHQLRSYGEVLTEHVGDAALSDAGEETDDCFIHDRDLAWLKESDVLVAEVTTPSLGVGYEIGKATEWGKPVLCLYRPANGRALSAMIGGCKGVVMRHYQTPSELTSIFDKFLRPQTRGVN